MAAGIDAVNQFLGKSGFQMELRRMKLRTTMVTLFCGGEGIEDGESLAKQFFY